MPSFEKYYDTEENKKRNLFREDIKAENEAQQEVLNFLNNEYLVGALRYLDEWAAIPFPTDAPFRNAQDCLKTGISSAEAYLNQLASIKSAEVSPKLKPQMKTYLKRVEVNTEALRKKWDFLRVIYSNKNDIKDATEFVELFRSLNVRVLDLDKQVHKSQEEFLVAASDSVNKAQSFGDAAAGQFQGAIAEFSRQTQEQVEVIHKIAADVAQSADEAKKHNQSAEQSALEAKSYLESEYISSFAAAFDSAAEEAGNSAKSAGKFSIFIVGCFVVALGTLIWLSINHPTPTEELYGFLKWTSFRIGGLGLIVYLLNYLLRERRNYQQIKVSNPNFLA